MMKTTRTRPPAVRWIILTLLSLVLPLLSLGGEATTSSAVLAETTSSATHAAVEATSAPLAELNHSKGLEVIVVKLEDEIINPVTTKFMMDAIGEGERRNVPVVIEMDTPGGLLQSTRELVKRILSSRVPVITYVYPNGSRAASAGVFITYASHVAAMAPSTNIGAAHVVDIAGRWKRERDASDAASSSTQPSVSSDDVMSEKVMNDTVAWIEAIARLRGRNVDWARAAVQRSESITANEALQRNVIDVVAGDTRELLQKIDGRKVTVAGGQYTLKTASAAPQYQELSTRQRILNLLANPNIAYILLLLGFSGLVYEVTHPGLLGPGIAGAICLLLAAFALQMLPTNYAAILLILAGIGLIIAEIKVTSYGLLTLGGAACLFFGSLALFDQPGPFYGVSISVILAVVTSTVGLLVLLVMLVIRSHGRPVAVGVSRYVGEIAEVATPLTPEGKVFVNGAYWSAVSQTPVARGAKVRIVAVNRLKLLVEPV